MKLKPGDLIQFSMEEDSNHWYIFVENLSGYEMVGYGSFYNIEFDFFQHFYISGVEYNIDEGNWKKIA